MDLKFVLYGIGSALISFGYYRYYKWWKKDKIEKRGGLDNYDKGPRTIKIWGMIIISALASLAFLLVSLTR